jgi:hypothetical protein
LFFCFTVLGRKVVLTMNEVNVVYNFNNESILRLTSEDNGADNCDKTRENAKESVENEVIGLFTKTLKLLDKKKELLLGDSANNNTIGCSTEKIDFLQLLLLRADWLAKWSNFEETFTSSSSSSNGLSTFSSSVSGAFTKSLDALSLYCECTTGVQQQNQHTTTTSTTAITSLSAPGAKLQQTIRHNAAQLQLQACTRFATHADNLLRRLELEAEAEKTSSKQLQQQQQQLSNVFLGHVRGDPSLAQAVASSSTSGAKTEHRSACEVAAALTVRYYVQGLQLGSSYCVQRVLRLVKIIGTYPGATEPILREQLHKIPPWVFLPYAAQLMGSLDRPEGSVSTALLEYTARAHPSALYYPYRITSEFLGSVGRSRSTRLAALLCNDAQDAFIEALGGLTHPIHRWNDHIKEIDRLLRSAASASASASSATGGGGAGGSGALDEATKQRVAQVYQQLKQTCLQPDWKHVGSKIGSYNRQWAKVARPLADKVVGAQGEKLLTGGKKVLDALKAAIEGARELAGEMKFSSGSHPLAAFSQWLCDFDPLLHRIEVPGQQRNCYSALLGGGTGSSSSSPGGGDVLVSGPVSEGSPQRQPPAYIVAIDPSLLVMSSIRRPKRIQVYSNTGGRHRYLVKGGEDLRNDERIEQLFQLMNTVVRNHGTKSSEGQGGGEVQDMRRMQLRARTYAVIPMTSQVQAVIFVVLMC